MVGIQIASQFVTEQGAFDIPMVIVIGAIIGLPFYIVAYLILSAGFSEAEHNTSNWRHQALSFYDETTVGKLLILLSLFAPAIGVFFSFSLMYSSDIFQAIFFAMWPWGIACPFLPLDKLSAARLPREELDESAESGTLPQELE